MLFKECVGSFNTRNSLFNRQTQPQAQNTSAKKGNKTMGSASKTLGKENISGLFNRSNDAFSHTKLSRTYLKLVVNVILGDSKIQGERNSAKEFASDIKANIENGNKNQMNNKF